MTADWADVPGGDPIPWVVKHPGAAAVGSSLVAVAGIALAVGWLLAQYPGGPQPDLLGALWSLAPLVVGTPMFLVGLPTAVMFACASCVSGRELGRGVAGGFIAFVLSLILVVVVLPVDGLAL
ncbi:MAG TPA: hypothetical protein VGK35_09965 [Actinotalea sp.]